MTRNELVGHLIDCAKQAWAGFWGSLPDERPALDRAAGWSYITAL
jgi:hypothetical protein